MVVETTPEDRLEPLHADSASPNTLKVRASALIEARFVTSKQGRASFSGRVGFDHGFRSRRSRSAP